MTSVSEKQAVIAHGEELAGRTAVVTGASSGIGAATARALCLRGARVALLARRADRLDALVDDLGANALALRADVTEADQVAAAAERIAAEWGPVDLVVNNAGLMLPAPMDEGRLHEWEHMVDVNIRGGLRIVHAFLPGLAAAADQGRRADLVNISSVSAGMAIPGCAVYSATKAFISHLSASLRTELGRRGVRVTAVEPGLTTTELPEHFTHDEQAAMFHRRIEKLGEPLAAEDVAETIAHLVALPPHVTVSQVVVVPTRQV
ncbi:SDR family oxidoreductase [Nocardia takedensis]